MERAGELIESILRDARALSATDLSAVAPQELGELLRHMERARGAVDAAANAVLDRFDAEGAAGYDGLRSTSAWLRHRCQMTGATASRRVRTARALRELPEVADGFRTGRFSADQADLFARHRSARTAEAMTQDEAVLAALADHLRPDDLARELRGWAELVDTDGTEPDPGHRDRGFTFVQTLDDAWTGRLDLSAADGLMVQRAIEAMAEHLHRTQEAGATTGDGDALRAVDGAGPTGPGAAGGTRSRTQLRADALVELVRRGSRPGRARPDDGDTGTSGDNGTSGGASAGTAPSDAAALRRPLPQVTLLLTLDATDLEGGRGADTPAGAHVGPAGTDRLLCDCLLARVVMDPITGAVLDLDRRRRVVSNAQWSALAVRDGGCSFPGCAAPPDECQAHHVVHWRHGGPTDLDNLTLACTHHHALVHEGGWHVDMTRIGPLWSRPDRSVIDPLPGWQDHPPAVTAAPRRSRLRHLQPIGHSPGNGPPAAPDSDAAEAVRLARERAHALRWAA